jgi:hypothetical protein
MSALHRNAPKSLADSLGGCAIPFTHDRLFEAHHWWHEMARNYHEPDPFRYALGAFIQAARSVTFMLQKERGAFPDFAWYEEWAANAKADPLLRWLHDIRTNLVHRQALEPKSWMRMRCIDNPRQNQFIDEEEGEDSDGSLAFDISPFECTHYHIAQGWRTDHAHEFTRHWELEGVSGELLEVSADIFARLNDLVHDAHRRLGAETHNPLGRPSCTQDTTQYRVIRTSIRDGKEIWDYEPPGLHDHGRKNSGT